MHVACNEKKKEKAKKKKKKKRKRRDKKKPYSPDFASRIVRLASRAPDSRDRVIVIVIAIAMLAGRDRIQIPPPLRRQLSRGNGRERRKREKEGAGREPEIRNDRWGILLSRDRLHRYVVRERVAHSWTVSRNDLNSKYRSPSSEDSWRPFEPGPLL